MPVAIIILILVLIGIAIRNLLPFSLPIWAVMLCGAIGVLATQQISLIKAYHAIDFEIILYLFGVFVIAEGLESSGLLERFTEKLFNYSSRANFALFVIVFILGLSAALLMNDAIAIIGTPIILQLCRQHKKLGAIFLMALAYAITIGSVLSPIGNPQNLLIAVQSDMQAPFLSFILGLGVPTLLSLIIVYAVFKLLYRKQLHYSMAKLSVVGITNQRLARVSVISFSLFVTLVIAKIILDIFKVNLHLDFAVIALFACAPIIVFGNVRRQTLKHLDWGTLIFFVAMFIVMQSVWNSGFFQGLMSKTHFTVTNIPSILSISVILSQFISNVPLVALYIPLLQHAEVHLYHYLALAAGSTLAGNIFIFGAASNMIIIQNAEKRGFKDFKIGLFSLIGVPLTIINVLLYAGFIEFLK